ncbi:ABC transporter ATP-binding protein [Paraburkholderia sp. HP33-1]|uniref:ABC transporter ATP-binding protein n=1 Tax=Paraburkholderia sp. HP33-1 TaxID=2883243 RepID=UPI001F3708E5|nr:ABC transporter ATP-binding protein [Paraburkholderia sp. HP33-1]
MKPTLELREIHHDFSGLRVLAGVDLSVFPGERHAIIGPNGAGKTTLLNIISGRLHPRHGCVIYRQKDITRMSPYRIARLGVARSFQVINTFPRLTVFDSVRSAVLSRIGRRLDVWHVVDHQESVTRQTTNVLRLLGLLERRDTPACALSYGEQRQLEIALTIAASPELVLLDEPTAGLDVDESRKAIELIHQVSKNKTLVMIEHDMEVVFALADRISVLHYGVLVACGTPDQIRNSKEVQSAYLGTNLYVGRRS